MASEYGVLMFSRLELRAMASERDDSIDAARMEKLAGSMEYKRRGQGFTYLELASSCVMRSRAL